MWAKNNIYLTQLKVFPSINRFVVFLVSVCQEMHGNFLFSSFFPPGFLTSQSLQNYKLSVFTISSYCYQVGFVVTFMLCNVPQSYLCGALASQICSSFRVPQLLSYTSDNSVFSFLRYSKLNYIPWQCRSHTKSGAFCFFDENLSLRPVF